MKQLVFATEGPEQNFRGTVRVEPVFAGAAAV